MGRLSIIIIDYLINRGIPDLELTLMRGDYSTAWSGITDASGRVNINTTLGPFAPDTWYMVFAENEKNPPPSKIYIGPFKLNKQLSANVRLNTILSV